MSIKDLHYVATSQQVPGHTTTPAPTYQHLRPHNAINSKVLVRVDLEGFSSFARVVIQQGQAVLARPSVAEDRPRLQTLAGGELVMEGVFLKVVPEYPYVMLDHEIRLESAYPTWHP